MKKIDKAELRKLFNAKKRAVLKCNKANFALDKKINSVFGFHYSDTDNDEMIDTLDYGTADIPFDHFVSLMEYYKEEKGFGKDDDES